MKLIRDTREVTVRRYELTIDDAYVASLNEDLDKKMEGKEHPVITKEMVATVIKSDDNSDLGFVIETDSWRDVTLADFIEDCLCEDIWNTDSELIDGEAQDYWDDLYMDADEEKLYKEYTDYKQMSIFDEEGGN